MIAHKVKVVLGIVLVICLAMTMPSFASPDISDADISFSVKGYFTQHTFYSGWTRDYTINSYGDIVSYPDSGGYLYLSGSIPVEGKSTVFFVTPSFLLTQVIVYAFYDSSDVFISGSYHYGYTYFITVPEGASTLRVVKTTAGTGSMAVVSPTPVDSSNYQYIWSDIQDITLDSDGTLTIPYQVYGFTQIYLDFRFFDSIYQFSNISMKVLSEYTNSSVFEGLLDYGDGQVLAEPYTFVDDDINTSAVASSTSNPAKFAFNIPFSEFSGFLLYIPVNIPNGRVSTSIKVKVYDFQLDGEDVSARLEVDRLIDQLDDLAEQLALPSPDLDTLLDVGGVLNNTNDTNASGIMSVIASDGGIITTMMVISVSITVLGYILFGKKEA